MPVEASRFKKTEAIPVRRNKFWHQNNFHNIKGSYQVAFENYDKLTLESCYERNQQCNKVGILFLV